MMGLMQQPVFSRYVKILLALFVFSLPLANPWVRGDGVGYYAFGRSILIGGNLDFTRDWLAANTSFRMGRVNSDGNISQNQFTVTGHLDNHFNRTRDPLVPFPANGSSCCEGKPHFRIPCFRRRFLFAL